MPILPLVPDAFHWTDESWGAALRCRPLEAIAPHLFTTRQLELSSPADLERLAVAIGAREVAMVTQVHRAEVVVVRRDLPRDAGRPEADVLVSDDPRVVAAPRLVRQLSFAEASELAYFGAKVLHPSTILPAVSKNIPVRILNSRRPEATGTRITAEGRSSNGQLTALACKRGVTVIDITSTRMLMAHGFLRRLFEVFERFGTAVDVVTTSEVSVSVTVDNTRRLDDIVRNLRNFADVACEPDMAIVCAVGENLRADPALFARAVTALDRIPLRLVSQAASRRNITFVLRDRDVAAAMGRLHDQFFSQ